MINIYPADYEKLKHNWVHVHGGGKSSEGINAKFLRLDNLPTLNISSTWNSGGGESRLGDLVSAIETAKDLVTAWNTGTFNQGFVKATPSSWGGGSALTFSINTLITNFDATKRFPKLNLMGKSQSVDNLSGSMEDINKLLEMVSPSKIDKYRYYAYPKFEQYAKYVPIKLNKCMQSISAKDEAARKTGSTPMTLTDKVIKVIQGIEIGDGSNVAAANAGDDENLIALTFAQNTKEVYHFGHHFVPTRVSIDPAPIMIAYYDDANQKKLTLPYLKVTLEFQSLCALSSDKLIASLVVD